MARFFDVPSETAGDDARVVMLPVPFEATTSYGTGTAAGPAAVLAASHQVELYDEELRAEPYSVGVRTLPPLEVRGAAEDVFGRIEHAIADIAAERLPIMVGGEHSITPPALRGVVRRHPDVTVVQLDAHADLREAYGGTALSHACAMARVREIAPAVQIGIRSLSRAEAERIQRENLPVLFAHEIQRETNWIDRALEAITTEKVYLTVDVDVFDCGIMPSTGTPEPGGLGWYNVIAVLRALFRARRVVGCDFVELSPDARNHAPDFTVARLIYKCIGYWQRSIS